MSEDFLKRKFNFLNNGLFNIYKKSLSSDVINIERDEQNEINEDEKKEIEHSEENTYLKEKIKNKFDEMYKQNETLDKLNFYDNNKLINEKKKKFLKNHLIQNKDNCILNEEYINENTAYNENIITYENTIKYNIYDEFEQLKKDMYYLQMANINLQKQLLSKQNTINPQQIIINNKTELLSNVMNEIDNKKENKNKGILHIFIKKILSSRFNQMIFISSIFISCFLLNKHWKKTLKLAQLEKKVNSNILLKGVKMIEESLGIRKTNYI